MFAKISAFALPLALISAPLPALAQSFEVSITEIETKKTSINKCYFKVEAKNVGDTAARLNMVTEHRLKEGTMSAMVAPKNGAFGSIKSTAYREIAPGDSVTKRRSFLGVDCADVEAVWFEPRCGVDCVTIGPDSALPIQIATAEDLATRSDAEASNLIDGTWVMLTSAGERVATIDATQESASHKARGDIKVTDAFCALFGESRCPSGQASGGKIIHMMGTTRKRAIVQFGDAAENQIMLSWQDGAGSAIFEDIRTPLIVRKQ